MNAADIIAYGYEGALICPTCKASFFAANPMRAEDDFAPCFADESHDAPACCDICAEPLPLPLTAAGARGVLWLGIAAAVLRSARLAGEGGNDQLDGDAFDTASAAWLLATDYGHRFDLTGTHGGALDVLRALDVAGFKPGLALHRLAGSSALERHREGEELDDAADGLALDLAAAWLAELEG